MNYFEAKAILDMCKEGKSVPIDVIDEALCLTGDSVSYKQDPIPEIEDFVCALRESGML